MSHASIDQLQADQNKCNLKQSVWRKNIVLKSSALKKNILHLLIHAYTLHNPLFLWRSFLKFWVKMGSNWRLLGDLESRVRTQFNSSTLREPEGKTVISSTMSEPQRYIQTQNLRSLFSDWGPRKRTCLFLCHSLNISACSGPSRKRWSRRWSDVISNVFGPLYRVAYTPKVSSADLQGKRMAGLVCASLSHNEKTGKQADNLISANTKTLRKT